MCINNTRIFFCIQTSGGLLACVNESSADVVIAQLKEAGYSSAAVIGHFFVKEELDTRVRGSIDYLKNDSSQVTVSLLRDGNGQMGSCPIDESEILIWLD